MPVGEFCRQVAQNLNGLVDNLQRLTGRTGENERLAWMSSLDRAAHVLNHPTLTEFHLHVGQRGSVSVEYRLPASASWCDLVVLGRNHTQPAAVVVELKDWDTYGDQPGPSETLAWHHGELVLHPSDQVRGYVEYCQRFHSAVHDQASGRSRLRVLHPASSADRTSRSPTTDWWPTIRFHRLGPRRGRAFPSSSYAPDSPCRIQGSRTRSRRCLPPRPVVHAAGCSAGGRPKPESVRPPRPPALAASSCASFEFRRPWLARARATRRSSS